MEKGRGVAISASKRRWRRPSRGEKICPLVNTDSISAAFQGQASFKDKLVAAFPSLHVPHPMKKKKMKKKKRGFVVDVDVVLFVS